MRAEVRTDTTLVQCVSGQERVYKNEGMFNNRNRSNWFPGEWCAKKCNPAPLPPWNTRVLNDHVRCAHHVLDRGKSESCLVTAPAQHASESVFKTTTIGST